MSDKAIFDRRSIRKFSNKSVSKEIIYTVINAGMVAPSAKNRQPRKCIIMENEPKEEFLACMETGIKREETNAMLPQSKSGLTDAKNTLWIANTCFAYKELTSYLDTEFQLIGAIALGYANESPTARPRKKFDDIVEFRI